MVASRRGFLSILGSGLIAAPAIVKCASLMPVRGIIMPVELEYNGMIIREVLDLQKLINLRRQMTIEYIHRNMFEPSLGDAA